MPDSSWRRRKSQEREAGLALGVRRLLRGDGSIPLRRSRTLLRRRDRGSGAAVSTTLVPQREGESGSASMRRPSSSGPETSCAPGSPLGTGQHSGCLQLDGDCDVLSRDPRSPLRQADRDLSGDHDRDRRVLASSHLPTCEDDGLLSTAGSRPSCCFCFGILPIASGGRERGGSKSPCDSRMPCSPSSSRCDGRL